MTMISSYTPGLIESCVISLLVREGEGKMDPCLCVFKSKGYLKLIEKDNKANRGFTNHLTITVPIKRGVITVKC
jgi:hypothetical protein